jgi:DNA-binding NarL/FixJ family response regulator
MATQYWLAPENIDALVGALRNHGHFQGGKLRENRFGLTQRELEILGTFVAGYTNRHVAQTPWLSGETVKHRLSGILDKLAFRSAGNWLFLWSTTSW